MSHGDSKQLLQVRLQGLENGSRGNKAEALWGVQLILGYREVVVLIGVELCSVLLKVFALESLKAVDDFEVCG